MADGDYYQRDISLKGNDSRKYAWLTYGLFPQSTPERSILLMPYHPAFLSPELKIYWDALQREINEQAAGNFYQDKFLVNQIRQYPERYPNFGVVVHRYGPVPALLTGKFVNQELHGKTVDAQIALYYQRPGRRETGFAEIFPNNLVFMESLRGVYDRVMVRYFQDVTATLTDIVRESSLQKAFEWSKVIEKIIGESIQSKIKVSVPQPHVWNEFRLGHPNGTTQEDLLRCELFKEHYDGIFLAQMFRYTVLYLLNEFYSHLCLDSRSEYYLERMDQGYRDYDELMGEEAADELTRNSQDLDLLSQVRRAYQDRDLDGLARVHSTQVWIQGLVGFARFLVSLRIHVLPATRGRIFVSFNHGVLNAEHLLIQIRDYYQEKFKDSIELLSVSDLAGGADFREIIRTRIWQADRLLVIVPKEPNKMGQDGSGNYQWLAREAEHGLLLGKRVTFLLEDGYDEVQLKAALGNEQMGFLCPEAGYGHPRAARLLKDFEDRHQEPFSVVLNNPHASLNDLGDKLRKTLEETAKKAAAGRHHNLVKGFLSQFPEDTLITLLCLNKFMGKTQQSTKEEIAALLNRELGKKTYLKHPFGTTKSEARKAFQNAWNHARDRAFNIEEQAYYLMEKEKQGNIYEYRPTLDKILRVLEPDIPEERLNKWVITLLTETAPAWVRNI